MDLSIMLEEMVEKLEDLAEKAESYQWGEGDEQKAIKYALVLPFLRILGYDVFNPEDVEPGYAPTDANGEEVGKVDYGLRPDADVDVLLHVTDQALWNSSRPTDTLDACFRANGGGIAILTNGLRYQVYADLEEKGVLDSSPYLVFDLQKIAAGFYQEWTLREVHRLSKWHFNLEKIRERAQTLKIFQHSWWYMKRQLDNPSRTFIKFIQQQIGLKPQNEEEVERFDRTVKYVLQRFEAGEGNRSSRSLRDERSLSNGTDSPPDSTASEKRKREGSDDREDRDFQPDGEYDSVEESSEVFHPAANEHAETLNPQEKAASESESSAHSESASDHASKQQTDKQNDPSIKDSESEPKPQHASRQMENESQPESKPEKQKESDEGEIAEQQNEEADEQEIADDERIAKARNDAGTEYLSAERIKKQRKLANADLDFNGNEQEEPEEDREEKERVKTVVGQGKNPMDTGFQIFQDIVSDASNYNQISIRENDGVLEMLVQDDPDKCVARLHFKDDSKVLGLFDAYHEEYQIPIKSLDDIYQFEDQIRIAAEEF